MADDLSDLRWDVTKPWVRFGRELGLAALWFGLLAALLSWLGGEGWMLVVLAVAAGYVLGPLFVPVSSRLDGEGLHRATRFGRRFYPWSEFRAFTLGRGRRTAFLQRGGGWAGRVRGPVTLFLPVDDATRQAVLDRLTSRLRPAGSEAGERP